MNARQLAGEVGLDIPEEKILSVSLHLQRIAEIAQRLDEVELDPFADEMAPVWRP